MTKKRQRDVDEDEKQHKRLRKEESLASRQRQSALNTVSNVSLADLHQQMDKSDDDLEDQFDFS